MEVIKHGEKKYISHNDYKLECPNCGCVFLFDSGDFTKQERRLGGHAWVRCPDCGREIEFIPADCLYNILGDYYGE